MVVLVRNPNTWDADAGGQPRIHDEIMSQSIKMQLLVPGLPKAIGAMKKIVLMHAAWHSLKKCSNLSSHFHPLYYVCFRHRHTSLQGYGMKT